MSSINGLSQLSVGGVMDGAGLLVLKKAMNQDVANGNAMVQMLQKISPQAMANSVSSHLGRNLDILV